MIKIYPSTIQGQIKAPGSKAHAQRLLFMASMAAKPTKVKNVPKCNDIDTTIACLESLGCSISRNLATDEVVVKPFPKTTPMPNVTLNFKESATTARLAMALCGALGIKADCKATGNLLKRKMIQLTGRLSLRGVTFTGFSLPFEMSGRMAAGEYEFSGDEGSQAISAIMMFASCLLNDSHLRLTSPVIDNTFLKLTQSSMQKFGIKIEEVEDGYHVIGRQYYQSPGHISAESDWALAAMWTLAGASSGRKGSGITVDGLDPDSPQMYRNLEQLNALLYHDFLDINIDATNAPNLATVYAALAIAQGASIHIKGVPQLKSKETNRLEVIADIARQFDL
ncbi:MAG: hypothetical protein Q4E99_06520, partial [Bacillota bacterium]|nr:hypothetical protein [Bacillota bacterium]